MTSVYKRGQHRTAGANRVVVRDDHKLVGMSIVIFGPCPI